MRLRRLLLIGGLALCATIVLVPSWYWWRVPPWALEGFSMTLCPCATPCPCRSGRRPTGHTCEAATFVHVVRGHYGGVVLDGLRFVTVADMHRGQWLVVYGDASASPARQDAMVRVGENMLMPRMFFAPLLARALGPRVTVRSVERIEYHVLEDGLRRQVHVPGILDLDARLRADEDGRAVEVVPALDMLGNRIAYADNLVYRLTDPAVGLRLDYSGRQANMKSFRVTKEDYDGDRLLAQEARVMRGTWTPHQRALIDAMRAAGELVPYRLQH